MTYEQTVATYNRLKLEYDKALLEEDVDKAVKLLPKVIHFRELKDLAYKKEIEK